MSCTFIARTDKIASLGSSQTRRSAVTVIANVVNRRMPSRECAFVSSPSLIIASQLGVSAFLSEAPAAWPCMQTIQISIGATNSSLFGKESNFVLIRECPRTENVREPQNTMKEKKTHPLSVEKNGPSTAAMAEPIHIAASPLRRNARVNRGVGELAMSSSSVRSPSTRRRASSTTTYKIKAIDTFGAHTTALRTCSLRLLGISSKVSPSASR